MYEYKKGQNPMLFKMPPHTAVPEETTIDTDNKTISIMEFHKQYEGIFIIKVLDKTTWRYDTIYSNTELVLTKNDPVIDYYEFQSSE